MNCKNIFTIVREIRISKIITIYKLAKKRVYEERWISIFLLGFHGENGPGLGSPRFSANLVLSVSAGGEKAAACGVYRRRPFGVYPKERPTSHLGICCRGAVTTWNLLRTLVHFAISRSPRRPFYSSLSLDFS